MRLSDEVTSIKGIGEKNAALLKKLDIETVGDLLYHIPKDYARMPYPVTVREAVKASEPGFTAVCGVVTKAPVLKRFGSRSVVSFEIRDDLGDALNVSYFNMPYIKNAIKKGDRRIFAGRISAKGNRFSLNQPKLYREAEYSSLAGTLIPVYAKTKGMSDKVLAKYNLMALKGLSRTVNDTGLVIDHLPGELKEKNSLSDLLDALWVLHCPAASDNVRKALDRISYDELLFFMLTVSSSDEGREKTEFIIPPSKVSDSLIKKLPYKLTASQTKAIGQIREDMQSGMSLNRLLQGDVGSGKTIVALLAMLDAVDAGYQTALMAPTEVLAV
ncbi:MAG: hypothetical protein J5842_04895, partial [Lachnospiraceae bacterium]|nr:hypothetical protein [Lachnospiraceae bacterium]